MTIWTIRVLNNQRLHITDSPIYLFQDQSEPEEFRLSTRPVTSGSVWLNEQGHQNNV
jgi:hypothetical protein